MRKTAIVLSILGLAALSAAPVLATTLLSESFTYVDGNLTALNGGNVSGGNWTNHGGTGTDIQVLSGTAQGNMANAPDDNRTFAAQPLTGKTYACLSVKIPTQAAAPFTGYFAHFKDTGTSNFNGRLYVTPSATTFTFAVSVSSATAIGFLGVWTSALSYDTQYTVVVSYDAAGAISELWVNPVNESSPKVVSSTSSGPLTANPVSAFALREGGSSFGTGATFKFIVDNLGVGTTFNEACAAGPVATAPTTWGTMKGLYR